MKIRLKKPITIGNKTYQPGWVIGVDEPTAQAYIASGCADGVEDGTRALKYASTAPVQVVCFAQSPEPEENEKE